LVVGEDDDFGRFWLPEARRCRGGEAGLAMGAAAIAEGLEEIVERKELAA
jgi:hypothetical protein